MQGDKVSLDLNLPLATRSQPRKAEPRKKEMVSWNNVTLDPAMPDTCFL